jgi:uncharacterized tellurite resistance protein B-like protein
LQVRGDNAVLELAELRYIENQVAATGRIHRPHLKALQKLLYADGKIDRREADFLVELYKRVEIRPPSFEQFFFKAIKDHVLANGRIGAGESKWLEQMFFADGKIRDEERQFLRELYGEAEEVSPEFEALFAVCMKLPPEPHTSK